MNRLLAVVVVVLLAGALVGGAFSPAIATTPSEASRCFA